MLKRSVMVIAMMVVLGACSGLPSTAAVVDGVELSGERLEAMDPGPDRSDEKLIKDLNLLILHQILTTRAASEFDLVATEQQITEAFEERIRASVDDVEEWLARRGSTPDRAMVEAELDVIRGVLEDVMVESDAYGFDFDAAYRSFLGVNSRVCLRGLGITDPAALPSIVEEIEAGADLDTLAGDHAGATEIIDIGCNIPVEHGPLLAPVALDGAIGVAYLREASDGSTYVVEVTERDAPAAEDVEEEVREFGRERQAPLLFDAWVVEMLKSAEVEVDDSIGVWSATADSEEIPTVALAP